MQKLVHADSELAGPRQTKSRESHMLCLLTAGIRAPRIPPSLQARQRFLVPPTPTLASNLSGWGFCFFFMLPKPPPSPQERVGGAATSPPLVSTPALHQRPQPLRAGSTPPHAASTPPHAASAPPALRDGPMPLPLRAALMPPACAPCRCPWPARCVSAPCPRALHQRPHPHSCPRVPHQRPPPLCVQMPAPCICTRACVSAPRRDHFL